MIGFESGSGVDVLCDTLSLGSFCPVRALCYCICAIGDLSPRPLSLFASRYPTKSLLKNVVSFLLNEVIFGAGAVGGDEGQPQRAHNI